MNKEDYFKYYIQGSDHYLIPKDIFNELFEDYECFKNDCKKYKEVIDKANNKLNDFIKCCKAEKIESGSDYLHHSYWDMFERFNKQIKDILKEVE